jgi:hypothetical protein
MQYMDICAGRDDQFLHLDGLVGQESGMKAAVEPTEQCHLFPGASRSFPLMNGQVSRSTRFSLHGTVQSALQHRNTSITKAARETRVSIYYVTSATG